MLPAKRKGGADGEHRQRRCLVTSSLVSAMVGSRQGLGIWPHPGSLFLLQSPTPGSNSSALASVSCCYFIHSLLCSSSVVEGGRVFYLNSVTHSPESTCLCQA